MRSSIWIGAFCTFLGASVLAEVPVQYHPYDCTAPTKYRLADAPKKTEVRVAQSTHILSEYLCGAYTRPLFPFAGIGLHVFPDKTAMIVEWGDVGLPDPVLAEGRWRINDQGEILFDWERERFKSEDAKRYYREEYGECKKMTLFLRFSGKEVKDVLLVSDEKLAPKIEHALRREVSYVDWKKFRDDLRKTRR